jgi:hypothetical protein
MTNHDIVTELRQRHANVTGIDTRITTPIVGPTIFSQAADEIERLRNERNAFEAERDELIRISNKLNRERDEARREVCEADTDTHGAALLEAERRGWDCFKENTNDKDQH